MYPQINNEYLQFRYNLGSGEATAKQTTLKVSDGSAHTVTIERDGRTVTLLIDNLYVARAISPGISETLDTPINAIYLGSTVDSNGKANNGYQGCITGAKLNWKDLPVTKSSPDFVAVVKDGVKSGCIFEVASTDAAFPTIASIAAGGVAFIVLIIVLPLSIVTCAVGKYIYHKRRAKFYLRSRQRSANSPTFNWQPTIRMPEREPRLVSTQQTEMSTFGDLEMTNESREEGRSSIFTQSIAGTSETVLRTPDQTPEQPNQRQIHQGHSHNNQQQNILQHHWREPEDQPVEVVQTPLQRQDSQQQLDQLGQIPSQKHITSSSSISAPKRTSNNYSEEQVPMMPEPSSPFKHKRSRSGEQSILTTVTEKSLASVFDDSEVGKYVIKRIEAVNADMEEEERDEIKPFKEEGDFEPLGSVGSLYDILREADENYGPMEHRLPPDPRPPIKPKPNLSSLPPKPSITQLQEVHSEIESHKKSQTGQIKPPDSQPPIKPIPNISNLPPKSSTNLAPKVPRNIELHRNSQTGRIEQQLPRDTRPPIKPKPDLSSLPPKPSTKPAQEVPRNIKSHNSSQNGGIEEHLQDFMQNHEHKHTQIDVSHVDPNPNSEKQVRPNRAQRKRGSKCLAATPGESLMDKFQHLQLSSTPSNSQEWDKGRLV